MEEFSSPDRKAITLDKVECEKNYALVISTNAGLWRYIIGDTVKFTTLYPFRIKITGRTKHFINAFGEELVIENADQAFAAACNYTNSLLNNYTGAPYYFSEYSNGGHEWLVEFEKQPADIQHFVDMFDQELKRQNSDYEAKRQNDIALRSPIVHVLPKGTFYNWMQSKGKLGGQNKIPRLSNSREYLEEVKSFAGM
jgi:hypothetical protein